MDEIKLAELQRISDSFETATPQEILRWAIETYRDKLTMATAFGAEGCCLIAMIADIRDETGITPDIFNLDTGYQFPQTLALREKMQQKYGIPIRFVQAKETVQEMEARFGGPIYKTDSDQCCRIRKVVPLKDAVQGFDAWITAIRRDQTPERATAPIVGPEPKFNLVKINPLANWSKQQVWDYIKANGVPTNPLHEQGFPSIGCWPCTRPVAAGEDDRAGRWAGTAKRECGLHLSDDGTLTRSNKTLVGSAG
ncbi:MAG: phosphoadenylyl-sulfate reductase [Abitibacteriaceae bacterium]|nr:phosphoadenylyl-sulfate reductase [Abditibacteriaceae bacterium]MBV9868393.1 phosphoadenylyl-sulfate reductase [Abditibacteriaceae bacterium]